MILLTSTSDVLAAVTLDAVTVDVHADFMDLVTATGVSLPDRTNTLVSTATTTTLVASPASGHVRSVAGLRIRNRHASDPCSVIITHTDGTTTVELIKVILTPGCALTYDEHDGFRTTDPAGALTTSEAQDSYSTTIGDRYTTVLGYDVVNNSSVANTMQSAELSFPVVAGQSYWYDIIAVYTAAATTTGSRWGLLGPGHTATVFRSNAEYSLTTASKTSMESITTFDNATVNATSAATGSNVARLRGFLTALHTGLVQLRFASEIANSAITCKAGSRCEWQRVR